MREIGKEANKGERWRNAAAVIFVAVSALVGGYLFLKYAAGIFLPFLLAWGVGAIIHPMVDRLHRRWHVPTGLCTVVLMLLLLSLVTALLIAVGDRLLSEVRGLLLWLEEDSAAVGERITQWFGQMREITSRIPWLARLRRVDGLEQVLDRVDDLVNGMIRSALSDLSAKIPEWIGRTVRAVPSIAIFSVVTLMASFYFSADLHRIHEAMCRVLPPALRRRLPAWKNRLGEILRQYVRAYLLILVITFFELYIAFTILGVDYAFLIAALTALLDILPVFGVGIVLLPWAAVLLLSRRFYVGIGLLVTYALIMIVRQIIEPRVVSGALGLHPLLTLFCMYAGYRLFGILGMMIAPAAAIVLSGWGTGQSSSRSGA